MKKLSSLIPAIVFASAATIATNVFANEEKLVSDGGNIEWFSYRNKGAPKISWEDGTTTISGVNNTSYAWGYMPFAVKLDVGESLSISATAKFKSIANNGVFYFGLFNSGENARPEAGKMFSNSVEGNWGMTGFFAGTKSAGEGANTTIYSRFKAKEGAGFMNAGQGSSFIASAATTNPLAVPSTVDNYVFSIAISRAQDGYTVSVGDGDEYRANFPLANSTAAEEFDVIGLKFPGSGLTLSDLRIKTSGKTIAATTKAAPATKPEPATEPETPPAPPATEAAEADSAK